VHCARIGVLCVCECIVPVCACCGGCIVLVCVHCACIHACIRQRMRLPPSRSVPEHIDNAHTMRTQCALNAHTMRAHCMPTARRRTAVFAPQADPRVSVKAKLGAGQAGESATCHARDTQGRAQQRVLHPRMAAHAAARARAVAHWRVLAVVWLSGVVRTTSLTRQPRSPAAAHARALLCGSTPNRCFDHHTHARSQRQTHHTHLTHPSHTPRTHDSHDVHPLPALWRRGAPVLRGREGKPKGVTGCDSCDHLV
jgi:hypothetical protein